MNERVFADGRLKLGRGIRIECNITQRCNARCWGCNKAVGYADGVLKDMTVDQVRRAIDQLIEQDIIVYRFTFCGGEPVLHQGLQDMIYEVDRLPYLKLGRVLTNDIPVTKGMRDKIKLPKRFKWIPNPLDNPNDPYSGKNDPTIRWKGRVHDPFWVSPKDIGLRASFENCTVRGWCGIGLDAEGWSACGKAVLIGKLLGVDPTIREGNILEHVEKPINEICQHCQYGIHPREVKEIHKRHKAGEFDDVSETYKAAFGRHDQGQQLVQLETY